MLYFCQAVVQVLIQSPKAWAQNNPNPNFSVICARADTILQSAVGQIESFCYCGHDFTLFIVFSQGLFNLIDWNFVCFTIVIF